MALNEGKPLEPMLEKIRGPSKSRTASGLLDLRGIDLSHQNLRGPWRFGRNQRSRTGVDLRRTDITGADLSGARLEEAWMYETALSGATFLPEQMESVRRNDPKENADDGF